MNFFKKVKTVLGAIVSWFTRIVAANDKLVNEYGPIAIEVMNVIKNSDIDKQLDLFSQISKQISFEWGEKNGRKVAQWLRQNIDKMLIAANLSVEISKGRNISEKLRLLARGLNDMEADPRAANLTYLASKLADALSDGHLSIAEIMSIITAIYKSGQNLKLRK